MSEVRSSEFRFLEERVRVLENFIWFLLTEKSYDFKWRCPSPNVDEELARSFRAAVVQGIAFQERKLKEDKGASPGEWSGTSEWSKAAYEERLTKLKALMEAMP